MPKHMSLGRSSRRSFAKGKCKIETAISELSLATVCSSAELPDFVDESAAKESSTSLSSSLIPDRPSLPKQGPCLSCCPSCCYPLLETSIESNSTLGNVAKDVASAAPSSLDQQSSTDRVKDCSLQIQELALQHVLLEYVKGLQDANKARDADTAERLLQELGECLNSLSAASTVVSAGGARAVASTLKLFRFQSLQKPYRDAMKDRQSGCSKNTSSAGAAGLKLVEETKPSLALESRPRNTCTVNKCVKIVNTAMLFPNSEVMPTPGSVAAEVGRKRQRTVEDLDGEDLLEDEEVCLDTNDCELSVSTEAFGPFLSSYCAHPEIMDKAQDKVLDIYHAEASRESSLKKVEQFGTGKHVINPGSRLDAMSGTSEKSATVKCDSKKAGGFTEDLCSFSLELANGGNLVSGQCQSDLSLDGSVVSVNDGSRFIIGSLETSSLSDKMTTDAFDEPCTTATSNPKTLEQKFNSSGRADELADIDSCNVGGSRGNGECQKHCKQVKEREYTVENDLEERFSKKMARESCSEGKKNINTVEKISEESNVSSSTKEAGLADVASAGCFVLERLLRVVLQGKGCLTNQNSINTGSGRRGKSLRAEMYVALTEAFVEILQPLKDIVSMLVWCLDCLGNILPPCTSETCMGYSSVQNALASCLASKELRQKPVTHSEECRVQTDVKSGNQTGPKDPGMVAPKSAMPSFSGAVTSGTAKSQACAVGLGNQLCNEIGTESAASSISALAAVAYSATVPMLAEKAVKGILEVLHPRDIEPQLTITAALRALSAHLSSTTSKSLCDDAFAFIITAMKEFVSNAEIQIEGFTAITSLIRALNSATSHTAWVAVTTSMDHHQSNLVVQRAGCSTLQTLCAKTAIGHSEWCNKKRPVRACKDADREGGVRTLISAMLAFPQDVRIQWYACSTMWNLVHTAGVKSILTIMNYGAVVAVVGAMAVCRTNEVVQQEGCNVLGTMAKTLAENECKCDLTSLSNSVIGAAANKLANKCNTIDNQHTFFMGKQKPGEQDEEKKEPATANDWWAALGAVVEAMKAFRNSESVQSYGTYALGSMLKVFTEATHSCSSSDLLPISQFRLDSKDTEITLDSTEAQTLKLAIPALGMKVKNNFSVLAGTEENFAWDVLDGIEKLHAVVEITMAAMHEFPKIETVQIWGCAVLQQAFPAYVQLVQHRFHFSGNIEDGISNVSHDLSNTSKGLLSSQVDDFCKNGQKSMALMSVSSANISVTDHTRILFNGRCNKASTDVSFSDRCKSSVELQCNDTVHDTVIVGEAGDINANNISSESATGHSCQLKFSMNLSDMEMLSLTSQRKGILVSKVDEAMCTNASQCSALVDLVLAQATSAMSLISEIAAVDFNNSAINEVKINSSPNQPCKASPRLFGNKFASGKLQCGDDLTKPVVSVRQSWFAAMGILGDVLGNIAQIVESLAGGGLPSSSAIKSDTQTPQEESNNKSRLPSKHWNLSSNFAAKMDVKTQQKVHNKFRWETFLSEKKNCADLPLLVKTAIIIVISALSKIDDADTVIWAFQALPSLYTAWEKVHICKSGLSCQQELKPNLWGDGDVGVKKLVNLVIHWSDQNRLDVASLALQALYSACISAATIHEIEDVFGISQCGMQAVLGVLQKALSPSVGMQKRRKVIQLSCYVLNAVCGYSVRSQVSFATGGGADLVLAALVRYGEDDQTIKSGLQALGVDSLLQPDFIQLLNTTVSRNITAGGGKSSKRKKNGSTMGHSSVGLNHVFRESMGTALPSVSKILRGLKKDGNESGLYNKEKWTPQFKRLLFDGKDTKGVFQTLLIASPGCGGPLFAVELLKSLNEESQKGIVPAEAQAHVCIVISYMADSDSNWRQELLNAGAIEAVLTTMEFAYSWRNETFSSFHMIRDGTDIRLEHGLEIQKMASKAVSAERGKQVSSGAAMINGMKHSFDAPVQCAACWALANLAKDHGGHLSTEWLLTIQAVATSLRRYGGLIHLNFGTMAVSSRPEVCIPARLVLARLGVTRVCNQLLSHEASEAGDIVCLEALVSKGVDIHVTDDAGQTALQCAEKSGQIHVFQYLKSHVHLHGKKRARGKSISKCKQSNQRDQQCGSVNSPVFDLQVESGHIEEDGRLQNNQILATTSCNTSVSTENLNETSLFSDLQSGDMNHGKSKNQNKVSRALDIEASFCGGKHVKVEVDTEVHNDSLKNGISVLKKQNKKNRKVPMNHREDLDDKRLMENHPLSSTEGHANGLVNDAIKMEEYPLLQSGMEDAEQLNLMLCEALASGNVEKLEAALRTCMVPACKTNKDLVKKVKAALHKRLRRMEKCVVLGNELCSAMKEGNKSRLNAAISAIESVPRFATAFQEKLIAARQRLNDIEMRERTRDQGSQIASEYSSETDELASMAKQDGVVFNDKIMGKFCMQMENTDLTRNEDCIAAFDNNNENAWTEVCARVKQKQCSRNPNNREAVDKAVLSRRERTLHGLSRSNPMNRTVPSKLGNIQRTIRGHSLWHSGGDEFQRIPVSQALTIATEPTPAWHASEETHPLSATSRIPHSMGQNCQSVIKPPRSKNLLPKLSAEQYPITSQLFPASGGPPLGYSCHAKDSDGYTGNTYFETLRSSKGFLADVTPEFISSSLALPHTNAYFNAVQQESEVNAFGKPESMPFSAAFVSVAPSVSTFFCQSTTENFPLGPSVRIPVELPSPSLDSFHHHRNTQHTSAYAHSVLFPAQQSWSVEDPCTVTDKYISGKSKCNEWSVSLQSFTENMDQSWLRFKDQSQNDYRDGSIGSYSVSRVVAPPEEHQIGPPSDGLTKLHCSVTLNDALFNETCSICQDTSKAAALVPCGHCMCKGCADKVQMINCHCPICNRFISAVHAL